MPTRLASLRLAALLATTLVPLAAETAVDVEAYIRSSDTKEAATLEICTRTFQRVTPATDSQPATRRGPMVALVGVAHIGDASFYETLGDYLEGFDLVLFESVMPPGARGPGGETDAERRAATHAALVFLAGVAQSLAAAEGATGFPKTRDDFLAAAGGLDSRFGEWTRRAATDAWQRPVEYTSDGATFRLVSLGADGAPEGEGDAADIVVTSSDVTEALGLSSEDGIQAKLAKALGLSFQLTALDYSRPGWVPCDMAMDELAAAMQRRGLDFSALQGTLSGEGDMGEAMAGLLDILPVADAMMGGGVAGGLKLLLVRLLGKGEEAMALADQGLGEGMMEVLVVERNRVVLEELARHAERTDIESIAILYGAAHLAHFEEELLAQGYERGVSLWAPAIRVDLSGEAGRNARNVERMMAPMLEGALGRRRKP